MADDEVTDLTKEEDPEAAGGEGEDGAADGKKKKEKKEKVKKEKKSKDKDDGEGKPSKKKDGKGSNIGTIIIMFLIAAILISGIVTALYFDLFNSRAVASDFVKEPLLKFIIWLDPSFNTVDETLRDVAQARENRLNAREERLNEFEQELLQIEEGLLAKEIQLERYAQELNEREEEVEEIAEKVITPLYMRDMTPEELADMQAISDAYRRMDPADAAEILVHLYKTPEDVAGILYFMRDRDQAAILTALDPEFAAKVTDALVYKLISPEN